MTEQTPTLHVRIDATLHDQLSLIASVEGNSINAVARNALEHYIATYADRQKELLAAIDREAEARKASVLAILPALAKDVATDLTGGRKRGKV